MRGSVIFFACSVAAVAAACSEQQDESDASGEETGTVEGTVSFVGTAPSEGQVLVILHESNPPAGPPAGLSEDLGVVVGGSSASYRIDNIPLGTYGFLAAYWEDPNDPDMETRFHDLSSDASDAVEPVVLSADQLTAERDLLADWDRVDTPPPPPVRGTLSGTITFVGPPPSGGEVVVGIHGAYPPTGAPYGMTEGMPMGADGETLVYRIEDVRFGNFSGVAVYWVDPDDYSTLTRYHDISTASPDGPEPVAISEEEPEVSRDFTADWSRL